jgi:hypothetical protein
MPERDRIEENLAEAGAERREVGLMPAGKLSLA